MHPWFTDPWFWVQVVLAAAAGVILAVLLVPKSRKGLKDRFVSLVADAYQRQLLREFKRRFPDLYERFSSFRLGAGSQAALTAAMKRIPPQEALKLQGEFLRLTENFQQRHPELGELIAAFRAQDPRTQAKSMQRVLRLPETQRKTISKDLLWALDQLSGRFPKWVKLLESTLKGAQAPLRAANGIAVVAGKKK